MLSHEERKAIQLPVRWSSRNVSLEDGDGQFYCPMCGWSTVMVFDPHAGHVSAAELNAATFDAKFEAWVERNVKEITTAHYCRYPHTALQYAAAMLGACAAGRKFAGDKTIEEVWEALTPDTVDYARWLYDELYIQRPTDHTCDYRAPDSSKYCAVCIYHGEDIDPSLIGFRAVYHWARVQDRLAGKFPMCDFLTNRITHPDLTFPDYK